MYKALKNILKLNPWYTGLYLVVLALLLLSSYVEYKSRYRDVLQLIQDQASMTAGVLAQSGSGQAYLTEELRQSYIDRALDMLTILNQLDRERGLDGSDIDEWINNKTIMNISTFDANGKREGTLSNTSKLKEEDLRLEEIWLQNQLRPILSRRSDVIIVGVDEQYLERQSEDTERFLVAIPRDRGGAIACQLSIEAEQDFKYLTAMESALEDLLQVKGLQYLMLALDEREPFFVSRTNERIDETWTRKPLDDILFTVSRGDSVLLEVVRPIFFNASLGEVRIGFNADTLLSLRSQIIYQVLIRTTLLTLLAFTLLVFLLVRQNAALLEKEKQRIEEEVYRLEKLNRQREKQVAVGELAAGVAHEIRNPLNAIGIVAQRLRREFSTDNDQLEFESLTNTMVTEISRINTSLQDFLEYTRPIPLKFSTQDIASLLGSIQDLYQSEALEKQISLQVESETHQFEGDPEYLRQALSNLIRNALDACEPGASIQLKAQQEAEKLKIWISDNGAGIAEDQLSRVFDLYYTTKAMGTGVGLALTHKIIADHQGTIEVSSTEGAGSTFKIEIPVKQ